MNNDLCMFLEMCSLVKFVHSLSKKSRTVSSWELCIICQISCDDTLSKASEKGKCTLFKAVGLRKDDSEWANVTGLHISKNESDIVWLTISDKLKWPHRYKNWYKTILKQYHRSYYKSYTSKINLEKIEPVEAQMNASAWGSVRTSESICVKTR
jgi:hypothetical protein